ncbi:MAG: 50S ribosomal protein L11 methyltransferase [Thermodesulfobacteriota bacterium]
MKLLTRSNIGQRHINLSRTGFHPTTRGCLKALWDIYQIDSPQKVLDIGTGTGILAISAAKPGAREVLDIDHNQLAVETARKNVLLNGVEDRVEVSIWKN